MKEYRLEFMEDLDEHGCTVPGCDHTAHDSEIYFHSRCHPDVPTWTSYRAGVLSTWCAACGRQVSAVAVARRDDARC
jgi:hypothetical protein